MDTSAEVGKLELWWTAGDSVDNSELKTLERPSYREAPWILYLWNWTSFQFQQIVEKNFLIFQAWRGEKGSFKNIPEHFSQQGLPYGETSQLWPNLMEYYQSQNDLGKGIT